MKEPGICTQYEARIAKFGAVIPDNAPAINVLQLYPHDMNIYGDWGNTLVLLRRLELRGFRANLISYNPGDIFPEEVDILVGGGGQDSGQERIQKDLTKIGPKIHRLAANDIPMLMICGLYQLFGHYFETAEGKKIAGIGLLDIITKAADKRLIGNIILDTNDFGTVIGYENHSGLTKLGSNASPLGNVKLGAGNNGQDKSEGARWRNVIGTYLHGSLLPKNPKIADFLILKAVEHKYPKLSLSEINDSWSDHARESAITRPR